MAVDLYIDACLCLSRTATTSKAFTTEDTEEHGVTRFWLGLRGG